MPPSARGCTPGYRVPPLRVCETIGADMTRDRPPRDSSPGLPKQSRLEAGWTHPTAHQGFVWVAGGLSLRTVAGTINAIFQTPCGAQYTHPASCGLDRPVEELPCIVIPAKAGIQKHAEHLDSRVRGNDG